MVRVGGGKCRRGQSRRRELLQCTEWEEINVGEHRVGGGKRRKDRVEGLKRRRGQSGGKET